MEGGADGVAVLEVFGVDLQAPRQRGRSAVELLVEVVPPAPDRLGERDRGSGTRGGDGHRDAATVGDVQTRRACRAAGRRGCRDRPPRSRRPCPSRHGTSRCRWRRDTAGHRSRRRAPPRWRSRWRRPSCRSRALPDRRPNSQTAAMTPRAIANPYRLRLIGPMSIVLNDGLGMLRDQDVDPLHEVGDHVDDVVSVVVLGGHVVAALEPHVLRRSPPRLAARCSLSDGSTTWSWRDVMISAGIVSSP